MAASVLADAGFLVALLSQRDGFHRWAMGQASRFPPPWSTCEAALSEGFHLLGRAGAPALGALLTRGSLAIGFELSKHVEPVLRLMRKYEDLPMSLADACLVRMTEVLADTRVLTTDSDFRVYRRHGRLTVPCVTPH